MTFKRKRLAWTGILGFLLAILLCIPLCGAKPAAPAGDQDKVVQTTASKCKGLMNGFKKYLETTTRRVVENVPLDSNPRLLELNPTVTFLECISDTKVKIKVVMDVKLEATGIDPETKKPVSETICGQSTDDVFIEKEGASISAKYVNGKAADTEVVPCK